MNIVERVVETITRNDMRKWLSGRASPCQGEGREFESRFPLLALQMECFFVFCRVVTLLSARERVKQKTTRYAGGVKALNAKTLLPV